MGQGYLTTHVLDTARGVPAEGIALALFRMDGGGAHKVADAVTNADGRTDAPLLPRGSMRVADYELIFFTGAYLRATGQATGTRLFLDAVPIRFGITEEDSHYHVPLLLSPYGYSTYRGS